MSDRNVLEARGLCKNYGQDSDALKILKSVDLRVEPKTALCILGQSGAGKSTLLHILGTLDRPSEGKVFFNGEDLFKKSDNQLAKFRSQTMGFVFQFHHLLPEFSALENVMMPCRIAGEAKDESERKAKQLLQMMGLEHRHTHFPSELSGGERQRVAIARALVRRPQILFADEPTGNLDSANRKKVQDLFFDLQREFGLTLIVVTHDKTFAGQFPRQLEMADGTWMNPSPASGVSIEPR